MHDEFGGPFQARRGELIDVLALPGFVAERNGQLIGLVTYRRENNECELAFIAALERHQGIGTALFETLREAVADCERIWLVTTVNESRRRLKPQISTVGDFGIAVRDELELELRPTTKRAAGR